jgi:hypothetical protein
VDDEIEIIDDGDGLVVHGEPSAVERFLEWLGSKAESVDINTDLIRSLADRGAQAAQVAAEMQGQSTRWVRLTKDSAKLLKEHGLMDAKAPGVKHLMIGTPGKVQKWLQTDQPVGFAALGNPALLSSVAGLMAQLAAQQANAEIVEYLRRIDIKIDDVLRKLDDTVLSKLSGAAESITEAKNFRDSLGGVSSVTWGRVEGLGQTINEVQSYALSQLRALADGLSGATKSGDLANRAQQAAAETPKWMAVLAHCAWLHNELDSLELDRVLAESPDQLVKHRETQISNRTKRLEGLERTTTVFLESIDAACVRANEKIVRSKKKAETALSSGNGAAHRVHEFCEVVRIPVPPRSWEPRALGRVAEVGSVVIQKSKDSAPAAAGLLSAFVVANIAADQKRNRGVGG